jgi:hypothetical protein
LTPTGQMKSPKIQLSGKATNRDLGIASFPFQT